MRTVELAACQVVVTPEDYASLDGFQAVLERVGRRLDAARARTPEGGFAHDCLAVFPEMIGAFLPLIGRYHLARGAATVDGALTRAAVRSLPALVRAMRAGRTWSTKAGFFLAFAHEVRAHYIEAFRGFASRHKAWVIAGSALLPRNARGDLEDAFEPLDGHIYNTSYAFAPDGRLAGCTRKVNLVPGMEPEMGLSPGGPGEIEPLLTPFGRVGTLICYDGFYVPHTREEPGFRRLAQRLDGLGCAVVAQPSANPWPWDERWIFAEPGESQLRKEQWECEGLLAQLGAMPLSRIRYGITAHLLGRLFDVQFEGKSQIVARDARDGDAGGAGQRIGSARVIAEAARGDIALEAEEVLLRAVEVLGP